jgi:hypothetical protein
MIRGLKILLIKYKTMPKSFFFGGVIAVFVLSFVFGAVLLFSNKNTAQAQSAPVITNGNSLVKSTCGCGAGAACGGICQAGSCGCGSGCQMGQK